MNGFTNNGVFTVKKDPFGGWEQSLQKSMAGAQENIGQALDGLFARVEADLRQRIEEHDEWPSEIADKTTVQSRNGGFEVWIDDDRAVGLEYGNDPQKAPAPLLRVMAAEREDEIGEGIREAIHRAVGI
jgi:hypothetical protein